MRRENVGTMAKGVSWGKKTFAFRKIWRSLYSCYLRFQIRPFVILPTKRLECKDMTRSSLWEKGFLKLAKN